MTRLLKILMQQDIANTNLAVITANTVSVDALVEKKTVLTGVTANIKKDVDYRVEFDLEMEITESSGAGQVQIGNYIPWGYNGRFYNETIKEVGNVKKHVDVIVRSIANVSEKELGLMIWTVSNQKGTLNISNLVITEV